MDRMVSGPKVRDRILIIAISIRPGSIVAAALTWRNVTEKDLLQHPLCEQISLRRPPVRLAELRPRQNYNREASRLATHQPLRTREAVPANGKDAAHPRLRVGRRIMLSRGNEMTVDDLLEYFGLPATNSMFHKFHF